MTVTDRAPGGGGPLDGVRVIDAATVVAGPGIAARLGDFGADVIKVDHPITGDSTRSLGWSDRGVTLWWKWIGRNKRPVTIEKLARRAHSRPPNRAQSADQQERQASRGHPTGVTKSLPIGEPREQA